MFINSVHFGVLFQIPLTGNPSTDSLYLQQLAGNSDIIELEIQTLRTRNPKPVASNPSEVVVVNVDDNSPTAEKLSKYPYIKALDTFEFSPVLRDEG